MGKQHTFKFLDDELQQALLEQLDHSNIEYSTDEDGIITYSPNDEEIVGNELISSIRDTVFPSWQILTCPGDWTVRYKEYMNGHSVPFREEWNNGETWFLIPGNYRPHTWKIDISSRKKRLTRTK